MIGLTSLYPTSSVITMRHQANSHPLSSKFASARLQGEDNEDRRCIIFVGTCQLLL